MSIAAGSDILAADMKTTSTGASDAGKGIRLASNGLIDPVNLQFGGDGTDGALNVSSGTTNIDASGASIVVKNYSSINIASGATLALTNKAAGGTILILRCLGNCTIEGLIDLEGDGADANTDGYSILDDNSHKAGNAGDGSATVGGTAGSAGAVYANKFLYTTPSIDKLYRKFLVVTAGSGGGNGGDGHGHSGGYASRQSGFHLVEGTASESAHTCPGC